MYSCAPTRRETWHETRGKTRKHRLAGVWDKTQDAKDKTRDETQDAETRRGMSRDKTFSMNFKTIQLEWLCSKLTSKARRHC